MYCPECGTKTTRRNPHAYMPTYYCPNCKAHWAWDGDDITGPCYRLLCAPCPPHLRDTALWPPIPTTS